MNLYVKIKGDERPTPDGRNERHCPRCQVDWVNEAIQRRQRHTASVNSVGFLSIQDKRRRNDFASTEVGEVKGGRVTQQAFEVADKKDSGIRNSAMPGTRGDGRKDAQENAAP